MNLSAKLMQLGFLGIPQWLPKENPIRFRASIVFIAIGEY